MYEKGRNKEANIICRKKEEEISEEANIIDRKKDEVISEEERNSVRWGSSSGLHRAVRSLA